MRVYSIQMMVLSFGNTEADAFLVYSHLKSAGKKGQPQSSNLCIMPSLKISRQCFKFTGVINPIETEYFRFV